MKFSSTDKISETLSLIRNKKKYFIDRNKCIITKIECWPVFKQDPLLGMSCFYIWWPHTPSFRCWHNRCTASLPPCKARSGTVDSRGLEVPKSSEACSQPC